ncbi:MAG TPA: P1 family peptidase [Thermodesulfobacteriota bacterium]|nr:P1 family peptidase [Thermodesulfobacteriota bacterium]
MVSLTDIQGITVGHASDFDAATGCTVILFDSPATGAIDLRGGGTSTRQIDSLLSHNTFGKIHAILLTGGSAFGLDASGGVMKYLEERNKGLSVGYGMVVPSVPTAVIFDLGIGDGSVRPDAKMGYEACLNADSSPVEEGSIGAGTGATVGKLLGLDHATKGGIGAAGYKFEHGVMVAVLVVVNAFGDVISPENGEIIAGVRSAPRGRKFAGTVKLFKKGVKFREVKYQNTTLTVVATNAGFTRAELGRIANIAQTGIARVVSPVHTVADGDVVIAVSCGDMSGDANLTGIIAAELTGTAILRAVRHSKSLGGIPSAGELNGEEIT